MIDGAGAIVTQHVGDIRADEVAAIVAAVRGARDEALRSLLALLLAAPALADTRLPPAPLRLHPAARSGAGGGRRKALMETLRCLVCQGQSIADSDADMAGDMRALVRERIAAGESAGADPRTG